jgi:hypothetical protein
MQNQLYCDFDGLIPLQTFQGNISKWTVPHYFWYIILCLFLISEVRFTSPDQIDSRSVLDKFPKILLLFALLFLLPKMYWNFAVAGILTSYLRYTFYLIEVIQTKLAKFSKVGMYGGDHGKYQLEISAIFDKKSTFFNKVCNLKLTARKKWAPSSCSNF